MSALTSAIEHLITDIFGISPNLPRFCRYAHATDMELCSVVLSENSILEARQIIRLLATQSAISPSLSQRETHSFKLITTLYKLATNVYCSAHATPTITANAINRWLYAVMQVPDLFSLDPGFRQSLIHLELLLPGFAEIIHHEQWKDFLFDLMRFLQQLPSLCHFIPLNNERNNTPRLADVPQDPTHAFSWLLICRNPDLMLPYVWRSFGRDCPAYHRLRSSHHSARSDDGYISDPMSLVTPPRSPSAPPIPARSTLRAQPTTWSSKGGEPPRAPGGPSPKDTESADEDNECSICLIDIGYERKTSCRRCRKPFHLECIKLWAHSVRNNIDGDGIVTCPCCRATWHDQYVSTNMDRVDTEDESDGSVNIQVDDDDEEDQYGMTNALWSDRDLASDVVGALYQDFGWLRDTRRRVQIWHEDLSYESEVGADSEGMSDRSSQSESSFWDDPVIDGSGYYSRSDYSNSTYNEEDGYGGYW